MATLMDTANPTPVESNSLSAQERYVSNPYPLGPSVTSGGTNFSVFSANATGMEIAFFDHADSPQPARVVTLDPILHRTCHYWHIFVPDIRPENCTGTVPMVLTIQAAEIVLTVTRC